MEEIFILILAIAAFLLIIFLMIFVVLPISVFVLVGIAAAGIISGTGVAIYNFGDLLIEAHKTLP